MPVPPAFGALATSAPRISFTWNPADKDPAVTLSNANMTMTGTGTTQGARGTVSRTAGLWYFEVFALQSQIGVATPAASLATFLGADAFGWAYAANGQVLTGGSVVATYATYAHNDVIGVYYNGNSHTIWWSKNGVVQSGDPIGGTGGITGLAATVFPAASLALTVFGTLKNPASVPAGYGVW